MSTTRSTSNFWPNQVDAGPYTVVGGDTLDRKSRGRPGLSIIIINRGAKPFRKDFFDELSKIGVREIISVESAPCPFDVEALSRRYKNLRFLIFSRKSNTGVRINAAFREVLSDHAFVLCGDMHINAASISSRVFAKISECNRLCTVPTFWDNEEEILPTAVGPMPGQGGGFSAQLSPVGRGEIETLCPWDYCGVYCVKKHHSMGGFDSRIIEPWWQKIEYGMRAWMWNEEIIIHPAFRVSYLEVPLPEDTSAGPGYRRFFFKTLAIRHRNDAGRLPISRWWSYLQRSGDTPGTARGDWREIRRWVQAHRYRFKQDAATVMELWNWGE